MSLEDTQTKAIDLVEKRENERSNELEVHIQKTFICDTSSMTVFFRK